MGSFAIYKRKAGFYLHITQSGLFFSIPLMSYSFLLVLLLLVFSNLGIRLYFYLILLHHCNFKTFLFCAMRPAIKFFSRTLSIGHKLWTLRFHHLLYSKCITLTCTHLGVHSVFLVSPSLTIILFCLCFWSPLTYEGIYLLTKHSIVWISESLSVPDCCF